MKRLTMTVISKPALATVLALVSTTGAQAFIGLDPAYTGAEYSSAASPAARGYDAGEEGGITLYPSVGIGATYDDNIYREEEDAQSAMVYTIQPVLEGWTYKGPVSFLAGYRGNYGKYSGGPNDDIDSYDDHNAYAGIYHSGSKTAANLYGDYKRGHTPKGANNSEQMDTWDQGQAIGWLDLGAEEARFRFRLSGIGKDRAYDINKAIDLKNTGVGGVLGMRVATKTRLVLDGGYMRFDYPNSNRDGDRTYLRGGVSWAATGKTTGILTYGYEEYKADNAGQPVESDEFGTSAGILEDADGPTWKGEIRWLPTRKDIVTFETSQSTQVSYGIGTNKIAARTFANWGHTWSEKIGSAIGYTFGDDEYIGFPRNDDIQLFNLGLTWNPRDNHLLRASWNFEERDSDVETESYDRNRYTLFYGYEF